MKKYRDMCGAHENIELLICKFHEIVSQGPLYICTCCDQLWYKYSVLHADKLRQSNPNIEKYLCNKLSVDDIEWVCTTCYNGMVFPNKMK